MVISAHHGIYVFYWYDWYFMVYSIHDGMTDKSWYIGSRPTVDPSVQELAAQVRRHGAEAGIGFDGPVAR